MSLKMIAKNRKTAGVLFLWVALLPLPSPAAAQVEIGPEQTYLLLSTSRTTTLQEEVDQAALEGFQILATASRGGGQVVLLKRMAEEAIRYRVLGTTRIETMEEELNTEAAQGFCVLPDTMLVRERVFGPAEIVVFMKQESEASSPCEYRVIGTSRTGTMEEEILGADQQGFVVVGLANPGELVTVLERRRP